MSPPWSPNTEDENSIIIIIKAPLLLLFAVASTLLINALARDSYRVDETITH
jgi:hypothetical protein